MWGKLGFVSNDYEQMKADLIVNLREIARRKQLGLPTAQETYAMMAKQSIAPGFREMGFRGNSGNYVLPHATHWAVMGIQKSAYSDALNVKFTINLCVIGKQQWAASPQGLANRAKQPTAHMWDGSANVRLGQLAKGHDYWWNLMAGSPTDDLVAEVLSEVRDFALPWMHEKVAATPT
jgi:Domain of unknown function (DUF4304)